MNSKPVLFLSGSGRSGTNISKAIFDQHSEVATLPFEYRFSIDPKGVVDFYSCYTQSWSPYMVSQKLKEFEAYLLSLAKKNHIKFYLSKFLKTYFDKGRILSPYPYSGWELEKWMPGYEKFVNELFESMVRFKYRANWPGEKGLQYKNQLHYSPYMSKEQLLGHLVPFLDQCISSNLQLQNKSCFVEDNTWSILYADSLFDLFPNSKLIHIIRDPRDVIASLVKQRWCPDDIKEVVDWYDSIMKKWFNIMPELNPNRFMEIRLEDLIANKTEVIKHMCDFSNLSFEEGMLDVKLNKSNSGRYKSEFTAEQLKYLETKLEYVINHYNY